MSTSGVAQLVRWVIAATAVIGFTLHPMSALAIQNAPLRHEPNTRSSAQQLGDIALHDAFEHARICWKNVVGASADSSFLDRCTPPKTELSPDVCAQESPRRSENLRAAQQIIASTGCSGDPDVVDAQLGKATLAAAAAGDSAAQVCYVQGAFGLGGQQLAAYRKTATEYVDAAYQRGDWRMIKLLTVPGFSLNDGPIGRVGLLPPFLSHFAAYRETRLLWLGASGTYKTGLGSDLRLYGTQLSRAQIANAGQWAEMMFKRHFKSSPVLTRDPVPCDLF